MLKQSEATGVGDLADRYQTLSDSFSLPIQEDLLEEFDGVNHDLAERLIFVISLPILQRSHAIQLRVGEDVLSLRVPHLYKLELGLPIRVSKQITQAYFETKLRKLIIVLSKEII